MNASLRLFELRRRLGMTTRDVAEHTLRLSQKYGEPEFHVSNAWLTQIENSDSTPSVFKIYALATIYRFNPRTLLEWYGVPLELDEEIVLHTGNGLSIPVSGTIRSISYSADLYVSTPQDSNRHIEVVEFSPQLLSQLKTNPHDLHRLSPDEFERLVCDRLHAMGMWVSRVGTVNEADGGIDIVAGPKGSSFPFLIAVQAKHHKNQKTMSGPSPVRELDAVVRQHPFHAGLLVTNTSFTPTARWEAEQRRHLVRLRDFEALKRWIHGNFLDDAELREIPDFIEYAPRKRLWIPKHNFKSSATTEP
jgi:transcriptional regulator with XRE-family HTH domain